MQPIKGARPALSGTAPSQPESQLSPQQRTVLERLITRTMALTTLKNVEVWASLKHDLGMDKEASLQARHFDRAEQLLTQRLQSAQTSLATRQRLQQLSEWLAVGNNRQAVSHYIRQHFGQTALSQLSEAQLDTVLHLLKNNKITTQPAQRILTDRTLLPAEHHSLHQGVIKLAATSGDPRKQIWETLFELAGVKYGDPIPARYFAPLSTWLAARQAICLQSAVSLQNLHGLLKHPLSEKDWQTLNTYCQENFSATQQTLLTPLQAQHLVNYLFVIQADRPADAVAVPKTASTDQRRRWLLSGVGILFILLLIGWFSH